MNTAKSSHGIRGRLRRGEFRQWHARRRPAGSGTIRAAWPSTYARRRGQTGRRSRKLIGEDRSSISPSCARRFKQLMETGEIATRKASGGRAKAGRGWTHRKAKVRHIMRATCWYGTPTFAFGTSCPIQDPDPRDAIIESRFHRICGTAPRYYGASFPAMQRGDIRGHEFHGRDSGGGGGSAVKNLKRAIASWWPSHRVAARASLRDGLSSRCENRTRTSCCRKGVGPHSPRGLFVYSTHARGYAAGQAEYGSPVP